MTKYTMNANATDCLINKLNDILWYSELENHSRTTFNEIHLLLKTTTTTIFIVTIRNKNKFQQKITTTKKWRETKILINLTPFPQLWFIVDYFQNFSICTADDHMQRSQTEYWTFCCEHFVCLFCVITAWDTGWEWIAFLKFSYHNWLLRGEGSWLPHKTIIRDDWMCLWFEDTFLYSIKRSLFLLFCFLTKAPFVFTSMSIPFNQHNQYLLILFFLLLQYLHTIWFLTFWNACKWRGNNASRSINQIKKIFLLINRHSKCELRKKNIFNQN